VEEERAAREGEPTEAIGGYNVAMPERVRHVGLNLVYLVPGETGGMETYARVLIAALHEIAPELRLTAFVNEVAAAGPAAPWNELCEPVTVPVDARDRVAWVRGEQQHLPRLAARAGVPLVHSLANTGPLHGPFARVTTVHDVIWRTVPETLFGARALGMRVLVAAAVRRSDCVIAISESTRRDVRRFLGVPEDRLDVVLQSVPPAGRHAPMPEPELRARLDLPPGRPVLFTASAKLRHKNLAGLLDALALIPPARRPVLVAPGYATPYEPELRARAQALGVAADVRWPGWIEGPLLEGLYAACGCFVFPSLYEGFGMPVLEAMERGAPVACSATGAVGEVAGDAAALFDPRDPEAIAATVTAVLEDPALAAELRRRGRRRARAFSPAATARGTLAAYARALCRRGDSSEVANVEGCTGSGR